MATAQPMPASPDDQDPSAGGAGTQQPGEGDGSYVIEIRVSANKEITVCVESGSEEDEEEQGGQGGAGGDPDGGDYGASGDDNSVPVKSIKEALTLALEVFRNDGQLPQAADDQFQQGFEGANS
jgi:hypothetical protein